MVVKCRISNGPRQYCQRLCNSFEHNQPGKQQGRQYQRDASSQIALPRYSQNASLPTKRRKVPSRNAILPARNNLSTSISLVPGTDSDARQHAHSAQQTSLSTLPRTHLRTSRHLLASTSPYSQRQRNAMERWVVLPGSFKHFRYSANRGNLARAQRQARGSPAATAATALNVMEQLRQQPSCRA